MTIQEQLEKLLQASETNRLAKEKILADNECDYYEQLTGDAQAEYDAEYKHTRALNDLYARAAAVLNSAMQYINQELN